MSKRLAFMPYGVIPACLLPFDSNLEIDEAEFRRHLDHVAAVDGVSAITINAHSTEVNACSPDEQKRVMAIAADTLAGRVPIVHGVYADGGIEAGRIAREADRGGASALLVFPPNSMAMGGHLRPEMALAYFSEIASNTDLPIILFQYPESSGLHYPLETMLSIFEEVPTVVAIKDWCNDPMLHQKHIDALHGFSRRISVLTTHSSWLMPSLAMGCDGLLSGMGSVAAALQVALFRAVEAKDFAAMETLNQQITPLAHVFYQAPFLDMHNRMKEALVLQGLMRRAEVRSPLVKVSAAERGQIEAALRESNLLEEARSVV